MHISLKRAPLLAVLVLAAIAGALRASDEVAADPRLPSQATVTTMGDITAAIEAKNTVVAMDIAGKLNNSTAPGTIDRALSDLVLAQLLSGQEKYAEAIPHLEAALATKLFSPEEMERYTVGLAHLYVASKQSPKALALLAEFIKDTPRPQEDMLYMYAGLLMENNRGDEALVQAQKLMVRQLNPPQSYYQMAAACAQSVNNYDLACAYLERLIEMDPKNEMYWAQLVAMHSTAGELIPAIVSLERAQKNGHLTEEKYHIIRVELYYNLERWPQAAAIISEGLDSHKLPNELRFWEMLCVCYDRMYEPDKAMEVLKKASTLTSWSAIDTRMAERNYRDGRFDLVVDNLQAALRKGGIDRMGDFWALMASAYLELKDLDNTDKALVEAAKYPDATSKVERLKRIVNQIRQKQAHQEAAAKKAR